MLSRRFTHGLNLARFQKPQQLGLQGNRQGINLIQKHGSAIGCLEPAELVSGCPGERAFLVTEKLGFRQSFGESCTIDGNERTIHSRAMLLQGHGEHFLPCPRLADDEDGDVRRRHHPSTPDQRFEIWRLTDQLVEHRHVRAISMGHCVLNHGVESGKCGHQCEQDQGNAGHLAKAGHARQSDHP